MNYKFIGDESELIKFVDGLRDLGDNEKYLMCLFARKKYDSTGLLKSDKSQIKRLISTKENIINNIKKLQVEVGLYTFDGEPIPEDCFVLYINPTPRDTRLSYFNILKTISDSIMNEKFINPTSMVLNCVHKSKSKRGVFDVDLDLLPNVNEHYTFDDINKLIVDNDVLPFEAFDLVRTRGGFHVLVKLDLVPNNYKKSWHNNFNKLFKSNKDIFEDVMMNGDGFIPISGTLQGGKLVSYEKH